jgi:tetratricopeptide (TPR) repeat protein
MSVPVVSITRRDGRLAFVFKRDGILDGWVYLDEVSEEQRATFLRMLETQEMSDLRKIDVNNTAGPASQEEKTKLKDDRPDHSAADEEKDKGIFKLLFDALEKRQAVHGSREELDAMMAAVFAEIKARKERGEIKTREQETQEMGKYIGAIFAFREYERRRGMAAMHEQPGPEATYKMGDIIGGKYEVGAMLGSGGFGEVYLVYDRRTLGLGALKTFRQKFLADAKVRENFKREALLWVNLEEHPFILAARCVEELSGRLFIGMDYIAPDDRGRVTLTDHLATARGPLETDQALLWASMFCYGMEHANQRGIKSHRDIKPTNILIRQDGTLLISDFGLAAAAEAAWKGQGGSWESAGEQGFVGLSLFQTEGKRVCGTLGYLAPEVFRGEGAGVRSDIYSFGLVLWQMAAGSQVPPFAMGVAPPRSPRDTERYALEIYEQQMRKRAPAVGEPLGAVIERCLAPEPSKRFASFTQLRAELEPVLHRRTGQTVKLPPVGELSAVFWANKGLSLFSLGRLEEAVACFRKSLGINPDDAAAHTNLGLALRANGDLDGAIAEYRTALRLQPDASQPHNNLGTALRDKGDLDGAIAEYRTALRLQPDDSAAHNNLGLALSDKGDLDGAIAEYRAALRLQPDAAQPHISLGKALAEKGDRDGATAEWRTAVRLQPDDAAAHNNLGLALSDKGDLDGAIAEWRMVVRLKPNDAMAHTNLGIELQAKGDLDGAIAEYHAAVRLQPDLVIAHTNLGSTLYAKGELDEAIGEWRTAVRLHPDAIAHHNLGKVLSDKGDLDGAIGEWRMVVRLQPDDAMAHTNLGTALWTKGDREAALEEFHRACRLVGFNQLAEQLISKRQWVAARSLLEEAIRQMPMDWKPVGNLNNKRITESYTEAWLQLAVIAMEEGNLKNAFSCIESGLALEPDHPLLWSEKGFILARQAQYADALRSYERAATVRDWAPPYQIAKALRGKGATLVELKRLDEAEEAIKQSLVLDPTNKIGRNELEYIIQLRKRTDTT